VELKDVIGGHEVVEFHDNRMSVTLCNSIMEASRIRLVYGYRHININVFMCNITVISFIVRHELIFCCATITQPLARYTMRRYGNKDQLCRLIVIDLILEMHY
jgi:hypothetical protein